MGGELRRGLAEAWSLVATFVPKLFGFLLILLIGWLVAKALSKVVRLVLTKAGFNKLADKAGVGPMLASQRIDAADVIVKLVYYFVLLIALQLSFGVFGAGNAVSQLLSDIIAYLPRIVVAIVLLLVSAAIARVVRDLVGGAVGARPFTPLLRGITYGFILALGVIAALNQLGIATTVTTPVLIAVAMPSW
ncbi:mechanosensitive ion channel family protein, partial [Crossiella equi]|uniref:mechanosensitive ion channel family protein n=1 Tax=Crossiella equi TaxID=130796 RepID=UPI000A3807D0